MKRETRDNVWPPVTAGEMIRMHIVREIMEESGATWREPITYDNLEDAIEQLDLYDCDGSEWTYKDGCCIEWCEWSNYGFRQAGEGSNIDPPYSRHYECESRAAQLWDGTWVGWTYWFGGGKHGEPEAIDWLSDAYFLRVESEVEKIVIDRVFAEIDG